MSKHVIFQDSPFSPARVVRRTLESDTILQPTLERLPGEYVHVLAYQCERVGERWIDVVEEVGRKVTWYQLGLSVSFKDVFGRRR